MCRCCTCIFHSIIIISNLIKSLSDCNQRIYLAGIFLLGGQQISEGVNSIVLPVCAPYGQYEKGAQECFLNGIFHFKQVCSNVGTIFTDTHTMHPPNSLPAPADRPEGYWAAGKSGKCRCCFRRYRLSCRAVYRQVKRRRARKVGGDDDDGIIAGNADCDGGGGLAV